jgi:uncharacterized protein (TIGR02996 family)
MHPEADALLDAIWDNPDDDTPRLVYADWLQEHDHEDYAQFIRLSLQADGGSKPPAERRRLGIERRPYWKQCLRRLKQRTGGLPKTMQCYDSSGFLRAACVPGQNTGLTSRGYFRGLCEKLVGAAADVVRTVPGWWPVVTPRELSVYHVTGHEGEAVSTIGRHLPWLRSLHCLSRPGMDVHDIDEYYFPPFQGSVFARLAEPGLFPRLQTLRACIAFTDIAALTAFAQSALCLQLQSLQIEVRLPGTDDYRKVLVYDKKQPGDIRRALEEFIARPSAVQ